MKKTFLLFSALIASCSLVNAQVKFNQDSIAALAAKLEVWVNVPLVTPGTSNAEAPSDAIVLYNGNGLGAFQKKDGSPAGWKLDADGAVTDIKGGGDLITKQSFGSCQLHVEFREPAEVKGSGQARGNSGVYLMGKYEIQVLDSYNNATYSNGQAGAVYKQHVPLVNASRKPGEWQAYDIIFTAPQFKDNGELESPGRVTVIHNGVLIQNNVTILGATDWVMKPKYIKHAAKLPLMFQDHGDDGNPISYRNIWIRNL
ncbi:MAG: DUF1080 domain-containing protein [Bacteroidetes bacterium]|jgi:hypothetical protein|nr:DUF1080 domain-containing protein [Bacteroidota bacterium]